MTKRSTTREARTWTRRGVGLAAGGAIASFVLPGCSPDTTQSGGVFRRSGPETVKVGILHSQTGTMSISETSLRDIELMAIDEINAAGGVLGRRIEPVVADPRSHTDLFPKRARKLLTEDKVAVVFGCWTSDSRKAVLPTFEQHNGLLFYPLVYEGNESSPNVIYTGSAPNQQILPAVDWLLSKAGGSRTRFFHLGSDFVYTRTASLILVKYLQTKGLSAVGDVYLELGRKNFKGIVQDIKKAEPDVIFSTINGDSNLYFFNELAAQGITAEKLPVLSVCVGEDELRGLLPARVKGHLAAWSYFQSVDTPVNRAFVERFQQEYGEDRVTDDPIEAAYSQVHLWKLAAEKAGSFEVEKVRQALRSGIEFDAPGGRIRVDPKTQHTYKRFRVGRIRRDRQFEIVFESPDWIAPDPYPQVAFPGWQCDWSAGGLTRGPEVRIGG